MAPPKNHANGFGWNTAARRATSVNVTPSHAVKSSKPPAIIMGSTAFQLLILSESSVLRMARRVWIKFLSSSSVSASTVPMDFSLCTACPPDSQANTHCQAQRSNANGHALGIIAFDLLGAKLSPLEIQHGPLAHRRSATLGLRPELLCFVAGELAGFFRPGFHGVRLLVKDRRGIFGNDAEFLRSYFFLIAEKKRELPQSSANPRCPDFQIGSPCDFRNNPRRIRQRRGGRVSVKVWNI